MISDSLFEAKTDLGFYQELDHPVAREVQAVKKVMETLQGYLDYPPTPHATLPDYLKKHRAIRDSVRCLDIRQIERATSELVEYVAPRQKRECQTDDLDLQRGAIVLERLLEQIRWYHEPNWSGVYDDLKEEIDVVVKVVKALLIFLYAASLPGFDDNVKALGESLRQLDVTGLESSMRDMYEYLKLAKPSTQVAASN